MRALPLAAGINVGGHYKWLFWSERSACAALAAGIKVGGHYKWHFFSFSLSSSLLILPEGVVVGFRNLAWAAN